jgi:hypothetical protein
LAFDILYLKGQGAETMIKEKVGQVMGLSASADSDPVNGNVNIPSEMRRKMDQLRKEVDNGGRIRIIQGLLADLNVTFRELYKLRMKG